MSAVFAFQPGSHSYHSMDILSCILSDIKKIFSKNRRTLTTFNQIRIQDFVGGKMFENIKTVELSDAVGNFTRCEQPILPILNV